MYICVYTARESVCVYPEKTSTRRKETENSKISRVCDWCLYIKIEMPIHMYYVIFVHATPNISIDNSNIVIVCDCCQHIIII